MNRWMRFHTRLTPWWRRSARGSSRVVALSWLAVAMVSVLLGSGLAAAWSAAERTGAPTEPREEALTRQTPAAELGDTLRGLARQALSAVSLTPGLDRPDAPPSSEVLARLADDPSPEGRLLKAYHALQEGRPQEALEGVALLVRDHPEFSLAQLLYGDLLAARTGLPHAFGVQPQVTPHPADRRLALLEEARRRWSALYDSPPPGHVPMEFVRLGPEVRHAVAVDASKSRLYLFENGPQGLTLKKDTYVSVGKHGVGKQVEGDQRTPLGVYWITATYKGPMRDPRLGEAALGINYPNVWDRHLGRTGSGLFLHGVPPELLAHVPQATDGCVAMSNDEATALLAMLDPDTTPVLIAWSLRWVPPAEAESAHEGFLAAHAAWERARKTGDEASARRWYDPRTPVLPVESQGAASPPTILAWQGDGTPIMVVNAAHRSIDDGEPGLWRQYWALRDGQWRIFFDNVVSIRGKRQPLEGMRSAGPASKTRERSG